jgi:hypothetical protein
MELNIAEKYLLISLHPGKSRYMVSDQMINPGLFGSILADLVMDDKVEILDDITDTIHKKKTLNDEVASLLGIIDACKMYKLISKDKAERKTIKPVIKEMVKQDSISKEVQLVINEIQAASVAATTVATSSY